MSKKFYYKITSEDGENLYVSVNAHAKADKLCKFFGLDDCTAVEITKEEYGENDEDAEDESE